MSNYTTYDNFNPEHDRTLYLTGEICDTTCDEIIQKIHLINEFDFELTEEHFGVLQQNLEYIQGDIVGLVPPYKKEIKLVINSGGGSFSSGMALINAIQNSETPIISEVIGMAKSMALAIAMSADYRVAYKNSQFMYHAASYEMWGDLISHEREVDYTKRLQEQYDEYITESSYIEQDDLEKFKKARMNWEMFGLEALELGIVDELFDYDPEEAEFDCECELCNCECEGCEEDGE